MNSVLLSLLALPLAQEPAPPAPAPKLRWHADVEASRALARETGRHLVVSFDGRGWCGFCERLHAEVLDAPGFGADVADDFVFVSLDFDARMRPRAKTEALAEQHGSLREALEVENFPELVLMTPDGVPYARFAYESIDAEAYEDKLEAARAEAVFLEREVPRIERALVAARSKEAADATADEATALLRRAGEHALARPLVPLVQARLAADGLPVAAEKAAVAALSAAAVVDDALVDRAFRLDPANAEGLPEAALAGAFRGLKKARRVRPLLERAERLLAQGPPFDRQV
ncbi:MAG: thioredoxin family protein, partial [Planctomycetota bacterium]